MTLADADARRQALDLSRHVLAIAPAGSGKTGLLVQRLLAALATIDHPEQVVAITFTNKAAAEIRHRVARLFERCARGDPPADAHDARSLELAGSALQQARACGWDPQRDPQRLRALTIDGFNAQIAAELPLLSGLGGKPRVADDPRGLHEHALLDLFETALRPRAPVELRDAAAAWLRCAGNRLDRLLPPLATLLGRREQWAFAVVGAVDFETRDRQVLDALHRDYQRRLNDALGSAGRIRLLAAARAAAAVSEPMAWAETMTAWPAEGADSADAYRRLAALLVTTQGGLRKPGGVNAKTGFPPKTQAKTLLTGLLADRDGDAELAAAADAVQKLPPPRTPVRLAALRDQLQVLLRHALAQLKLTMAARAEVDFTEVALGALQALRPDGGYGEALLRRDAQIHHLLVDEMQDTSDTQIGLLEQLTQEWQPGDGRSLFLVGDPQQSIYAFRKAEVRLFLQLWDQRRLGALELHRVELRCNFRSAPPLIRWFNEAFGRSFPSRDELYAGEVAYRPAESAAAPAPDPAAAVRIHAWISGRDIESEAVARRAAELARQAPGKVAVLARARSHLPGVLSGLRARGVRYACQDIDPLAALPVVRDLLACARALWHPQDRLHWAVWLRAPWVGLSWADLLALSRGRRALAWPQRLRQTDPKTLSPEGRLRVQRLLSALDLVEADHDCVALSDRVETLWTVLDGAACVDAGGLTDARRTLQLLRRHAGAGGVDDPAAFEAAVGALYASPTEGAVQVMTIHKAKGLEFDHVLLVGCGRKPRDEDRPLLHMVETPHGALLVPRPPEHWGKDEVADSSALFDYAHDLHRLARRNESLRLLYVAATRARRTLDVYVTLRPGAADGAVKPPAGSFADWLWPTIANDFESLAPAATTGSEPPAGSVASPPRAARLPLDFKPPEEQPLYVPHETRTLRPSERVLSARQAKRDDETIAEDNLYARLVGTLFHQAMAKLAADGVAAWQAGRGARRLALAAGFRRLGLPESDVERAVSRVLELVQRTLAGKNGQWLLAPKTWAAAEYALSGWRNGEWVAAAIDRCFVDDDRRLWVIDYKVRAEAPDAAAVDRYAAQCRERYGQQVRQYAELLGEQRGAAMTSAALYLPDRDLLLKLAPD